MSKVFSAHAVSVDGYITGHELGDGTMLFDWYFAAREAAGGKDVGLMGGGVVTEALKAGLVDEVVLHQVPVLLGGGRPFFQALPEHVRLRLVEAVPAPGVTHLHYQVER